MINTVILMETILKPEKRTFKRKYPPAIINISTGAVIRVNSKEKNSDFPRDAISAE